VKAITGSLLFGEIYSDPFHVDAAQGSFWIQGMDADLMQLIQRTGDTTDFDIRLITLFASNGEGPIVQHLSTVNGANVIFGHSDGVQTEGLATDPRMKNLMTEAGLNAARNGGDDIHPAHFEDSGGGNIILGAFFPIDDQGNIFDVPGFNLSGLRDVVTPNPLVNGGRYNLELLFLFGHGDEDNFTEVFRIDTLVTPEIFTDFGIKDLDTGLVDQSSVFPFHFENTDNG
jgi:hypothetical protein